MKEFKKEEITLILENIKEKTLGEIDTKGVFKKTINNPKITGIAGDVIEQSVLGYPANTEQKPDIKIDGIPYEVKVTGVKNLKSRKNSPVAKEPMSITAVSPDKIMKEDKFNSSTLFHKVKNILLIYYLYDSPVTVCAADYAKFRVLGYLFLNFNNDEMNEIQNDWEVVRNFIQDVHTQSKDINIEYPKISKLRKHMTYLDTAPKYPNNPRFRFKRAFVNTIIQQDQGTKFEVLTGENNFKNLNELKPILSRFSKQFMDKSIKNISTSLGISLGKKPPKSIAEKILATFIGANSKKLQRIEIFSKMGIIPKTIVLNEKNWPTEDTKFGTIDFEELVGINCFEESYFFDYFSNKKFLFCIFQEPAKNSPLQNVEFKGFKLISFDEYFVENEVRNFWNVVRNLIIDNKFECTQVLKKDGSFRVNKNGIPQEKTNLPKSKDSIIFARGTSIDSSYKTFNLCGYNIYPQQFWIKRSFIIETLNKEKYII